MKFSDRTLVHQLDRLIGKVPKTLLSQSGSVMYSGPQAWTTDADLYIIGLNPGGDPIIMSANTVASHTTRILSMNSPWSEYADSRWGPSGAEPGTYGMQPRVLHLLHRVGRNPRLTPASNLIFLRSARESDLNKKKDLIDDCWPFHEAVISKLGIEVIVCFGRTVGKAVRNRVHAHQLVDEFKETNNRHWRSTLHVSFDGIYVADLTHPSIVDWTKPEADPSSLVERALKLSK